MPHLRFASLVEALAFLRVRLRPERENEGSWREFSKTASSVPGVPRISEAQWMAFASQGGRPEAEVDQEACLRAMILLFQRHWPEASDGDWRRLEAHLAELAARRRSASPALSWDSVVKRLTVFQEKNNFTNNKLQEVLQTEFDSDRVRAYWAEATMPTACFSGETPTAFTY